MIGRPKTCLRAIPPYFLGFYLLSLSMQTHALTPQNKTVRVDEQTEISVEVYSQSPHSILIWQPHEHGLQTIDRQLAASLAQQGIETWLVDLIEANFLANTASNMDRISGKEVVALIDAAVKTAKPVIVAASGRGAVPVLRGVRLWHLAHTDNQQLAGVILLSPKLYTETPQPGMPGTFMPIATATNSPILILQPDKSPWFWKLNETIAALQTGGSEVYYQPLRGVRDRFYFRSDASEVEVTQSRSLADKIARAAELMTRLPRASRIAVQRINTAPMVIEGKTERRLQEYKGDPEPPPLQLDKLGGGSFDLRALKGQVVLVNFWASWCPPCVHEMPSMQRLQDNMQGQPFTIIGVNMAEDESIIRRFLTQEVQVRFPIVLDRDGHALQEWHVFAFPTSYLVDKQGKIRYALFGGVEWDTPDIIQKIQQLIKTP